MPLRTLQTSEFYDFSGHGSLGSELFPLPLVISKQLGVSGPLSCAASEVHVA